MTARQSPPRIPAHLMERLLDGQRMLLEMAAAGHPWPALLDAVNTLAQVEEAQSRYSVVLQPHDAHQAMSSHPGTEWSRLILSSEGQVLGSVLLSSPQKQPSPYARHLLDSTAYIVGIALERKASEAAIRERERLAALSSDIALILTKSLALPLILQECADALVRHLHVAFARVWMLDEADQVLILKASAGLYTNLHGFHSRIPVGRLKIGRMVQDRRPRLTNRVLQEQWVTDQEWAKREGMVSFAGYPLIADDRVLGVMGMFARHAMSERMIETLGVVAAGLAQRIMHSLAEERLRALNQQLEQHVAQRTSDLVAANHQLRVQIEERLRAEHAQQKSANDRLLLLESTGEGIFGIDVGGNCTFINTSAAARLGYKPHELLGRFMYDIIHHTRADGSANPAARCPILDALRTGRGYRVHDEALWARDGTTVPVDLSSHPIVESGTIKGAVVVFTDISDRKRAEEALMRTKAAESLIKHAPDPVFVTDLQGKILQANDAVSQLLGFLTDEVVEQSLARFLSPEEMQHVSASLREVMERGEARNARLHPKNAKGEIIPTTLNASAVRDSQGNVVGAMGILRDMRAYEQVVQELERSRNDLTDKIHDLEIFHDVAVGRELKLIALERELEQLRSTPPEKGR